MFNVGRELFFIPVIMILKMLSNRSDAYIYEQLCAGAEPEDHYYRYVIVAVATYFDFIYKDYELGVGYRYSFHKAYNVTKIFILYYTY